jgi:D-threo-aldose 1-dehydrogenase
MIPVERYRTLGLSGIVVPPIAFSAAPLANACRVIPEQRRAAICVEWFKQLAPPVLIEVADRYDPEQPLAILSRVMRRANIEPQEIVLCRCFASNGSAPLDVAAIRGEIGRLVQAGFAPPLVSLELGTHPLAPGAPPDVPMQNRMDELQILAALRGEGAIRGIGVGVANWQAGAAIAERFNVDWITLAGQPTLMHHPAELLAWMKRLARRGISVIVSSAFQGGFLVGGSQLGGRALNPHDAGDARLLAWRKSFAALCHGHGVAPAAACMQFTLAAPSVAAVTVNTSHPERVAELVAAAGTTVSPAFWAALAEEGLIDSNHVCAS